MNWKAIAEGALAFGERVAAVAWRVGRPFLMRPKTMILIVGAAAAYTGHHLAPETTSEVADYLIQVLTGLS